MNRLEARLAGDFRPIAPGFAPEGEGGWASAFAALPVVPVDASGQGGTAFSLLGTPDGRAAQPRPEASAATGARGGTGELLVQFEPGLAGAAQSAIAAAVGAQGAKSLREGHDGNGDLMLLRFPGEQAASAALEALARNPNVTFAEANVTFTMQGANDTLYTNGTLWGMLGDATSPANAYGSQAGEAWDAGHTGSASVVVGVVDTGLDYKHQDIYLNVWLNPGEIPLALRSVLIDTDGDLVITFRDLNQAANAAHVRDLNANGRIDAGDLLADANWENGVNEDGNGYLDDLIGWDFANNDNDPLDDGNHGTHVSGTIGALGNNGQGVAGVNWAVQIMPLKFLDAAGSGYLSDAVLALDYYTAAAAAAGGEASQYVATNNSWGGGGASQAMLDTIVLGARQGVLFVAAAGNGGTDGIGDNNDRTGYYPAGYSTVAGAGYEAVIAVAAITSAGARSTFSNYGETTVDIGAPGSGIVSTVVGGGYANYSGTSMATPHVVGALALLASLAPSLTAAELRAALLDSAAPTSSLAGVTVTGGRLDIPAMLAQAGVSADTTSPTASFSPADGATGVAVTSNIVITFSEAVRLASGTIAIATAGGAAFESYDVATNTANLALSGNVLTINPTADLAAGTGYVVTIAATAVTDLAGNPWAGTAAYDFITLAPPPPPSSLTLTGTAGVDTLTGDVADDILDGLGGTDILDGREGGDIYLIAAAADHPAAEIADTGLSGTDEVRFTAAAAGTLRLYAGDRGIETVTIGTGTGAVADTSGTLALSVNASAVKNGLTITGNAGANTLTGTTYADVLIGNAGKDRLLGGAGADVLSGGAGLDSLTGGTGSDAFVFDTAPNTKTNRDTVTDFAPGADSLHMHLAAFTGGGLASGALLPEQFLASATATAAQDADDRFVYNTTSGVLYYDADGAGGLAAVQVALFGTKVHPLLAYTDFLMV